MIPTFPSLKKLEIGDKEEIENKTAAFPPYSDYNFVSLWTWNTKNKVEIATLHGNLIVKFQDYISGDCFYSFIGNNNVRSTIESLFEHARGNGVLPNLRLIPEHNIIDLTSKTISSKFEITEDRNEFDYILNVEDLATMKGSKLHQKRKLLNYFNRNYKAQVVFEDLTEKSVQEKLIKLLNKWENGKNQRGILNYNEHKALKKLFVSAHNFDTKTMCVYINNYLVGFTIFEPVSPEYAVSSFQKADLKYKGINEFMNNQMASYLQTKGCISVNIEQDLGIEGLRRAKSDYNPTFLKKYTISEKQTI